MFCIFCCKMIIARPRECDENKSQSRRQVCVGGWYGMVYFNKRLQSQDNILISQHYKGTFNRSIGLAHIQKALNSSKDVCNLTTVQGLGRLIDWNNTNSLVRINKSYPSSAHTVSLLFSARAYLFWKITQVFPWMDSDYIESLNSLITQRLSA